MTSATLINDPNNPAFDQKRLIVFKKFDFHCNQASQLFRFCGLDIDSSLGKVVNFSRIYFDPLVFSFIPRMLHFECALYQFQWKKASDDKRMGRALLLKTDMIIYKFG